MANSTILNPSDTIDKEEYNMLHVATIGTRKHFADLLFDGDEDRIIYATDDFAFRRRLQINNSSSDLKLPFMNLFVSSVGDVKRKWWHHRAYTDGVYIKELERYLRLFPVRIEFESSLFIEREADRQALYPELRWDADNETLLTFTIDIDSQDVDIVGLLDYDLDYNFQYEEDDWLKQGNIRVISINAAIDTFFLRDGFENITKRIEFTFKEDDYTVEEEE